MSKEKKSIEKDSYQRYNITLSKEDIKNFEKLKKILPSKTKSGMFRYLMNTAINNPNAFTTLNLPDSSSDKSDKELTQLIRDSSIQEQNKNEKRFLSLETNDKEQINLLKKILGILAVEYPDITKNIKEEINGLGGKL